MVIIALFTSYANDLAQLQHMCERNRVAMVVTGMCGMKTSYKLTMSFQQVLDSTSLSDTDLNRIGKIMKEDYQTLMLRDSWQIRHLTMARFKPRSWAILSSIIIQASHGNIITHGIKFWRHIICNLRTSNDKVQNRSNVEFMGLQCRPSTRVHQLVQRQIMNLIPKTDK